MGLWDLFRKKKKRSTKRRHRKSTNNRQKYTVSLAADIKHIQSELEALNIILCRHDQDIGEHTHLLKKHSRRLEELAAEAPTNQTMASVSSSSRPISSTIPVRSISQEPQKFDIDRFSNQEKRILAAFFEHQDMALSYRDIARMLNKSPNTIKNQMHQITIKANLFQRTIDPDLRGRFKLKEGLKIEKYLTSRADQSA